MKKVMSKTKRRFIVVDENSKPMTFDSLSHQLCYVARRSRSKFYLETYTEEQAKRAIATTIKNRESWNMDIKGYYLMPLK